jgi:hypothetical protein
MVVEPSKDGSFLFMVMPGRAPPVRRRRIEAPPAEYKEEHMF